MKLYHGSNVTVKEPQILASDRKLDFGTGFYVTSDFAQAERWAVLTTERRAQGKPIVSVFETDESVFSALNVLRFKNADADWLRFVSANRKGQPVANDFDVVIGAVANDKTMPVISLYFAGVYDEQEALKRLLPQKLKDQYAFKTEKALRVLRFVEEVFK